MEVTSKERKRGWELEVIQIWLTELDINYTIEQLDNLTSLSINHRGLTTLPNEIGVLNTLKSISLEGNKLTSLPDSFCDLVNLTSVDLENNLLTYLPDLFGKLINLDELCLGINNLVSLPTSVVDLVKLEYLELDYNKLVSLPKGISNLTNLGFLSLNNNNFKEEPDLSIDLPKCEIILHNDTKENKSDTPDIKFIDFTPVSVCATAIRNCHNTHDKSDNGGSKDQALIKRVGVKMKHSSTLEHLTFIFYTLIEPDSYMIGNFNSLLYFALSDYSVYTSIRPAEEMYDENSTNEKEKITTCIKTNMRVILDFINNNKSQFKDYENLKAIIPDPYLFLLEDKNAS